MRGVLAIDAIVSKRSAEITAKHLLNIFQSSVKQFLENKDHIGIQAKKTGFPIHKEQNFLR